MIWTPLDSYSLECTICLLDQWTDLTYSAVWCKVQYSSINIICVNIYVPIVRLWCSVDILKNVSIVFVHINGVQDNIWTFIVKRHFFKNMLHRRKKVIDSTTLCEGMPYYECLCRNNIWHFEIKVIAAMTALPLKGITVKMKR